MPSLDLGTSALSRTGTSDDDHQVDAQLERAIRVTWLLSSALPIRSDSLCSFYSSSVDRSDASLSEVFVPMFAVGKCSRFLDFALRGTP